MSLRRILWTVAASGLWLAATACASGSAPSSEGLSEARESRVEAGAETSGNSHFPSSKEEPDRKLPRDLAESLARLTSVDGLYEWGSIEHLQWESDCLAEFGFKVEVIGEGQTFAHVSVEQRDDFNAAFTECREIRAVEAGIINWPPEPLTEEDIRLRYEAYLLTHECLQHHDYPTRRPPSEDSYVEAEGRNWHPYDGFGSRAIKPEVEKKCPQNLFELFQLLGERRGQ
jgi:hypothetical protein